MINADVFQLNAVPYSELAANSEIFNTVQLTPMLCVRIPTEVFKDCKLLGVYNTDRPDDKDLNILSSCIVHKFNPWVDIDTCALCQKIGYHVYAMIFESCVTRCRVQLYFGYTIQSDEPDKPYVYMDKEGCACANNTVGF